MKFFKKILIVITVTAALLVLFELTLRAFFPQDTKVIYVSGSLGQTDSITGHINRPNSHTKVTTPEFSVEYMISEEGFRDEKNHSRPSGPESTRILLLGDSFTFGGRQSVRRHMAGRL